MGHSLLERSLVFVDLGYLENGNFHENIFIPVKSSKNHPLTEENN